MGIYLLYIVVVLTALLYLNEFNRNKNQHLLLVTICATGLLIIATLRKETVGKDIVNYIKFFQICTYYDLSILFQYRYEPGYIILCKIIAMFTHNPQIFISIISAFILIGPVSFINKYSKNPAISFILYVFMTFFAFSLSGLRQALAASILYLSYDYIIKRKLLKFIIIVLIATTFHASSIIYLLAYPIAHMKMKSINFSVYCITFILLFAFKKSLVGLIVNNFFEQYSYTLSSSDSYTYMLTMFLVFGTGTIFYKQVVNKNPQALTLYNMILVAAFIQFLGTESSNIVRVSELFYITVVVFIPEVIESIEDRTIRITGYSMIFIIMLIQFIFIFPGGGYEAIPYKFFWE